MRIKDLHEFEGLTADMVRGWLRSTGWTLTGDQYSEGSVWVSGNGKRIYDSRILTEDGLKWLALVSEVSPQFLMREINPRMRAGWPTDEELERHAFWLVRSADMRIVMLDSFVVRERKEAGLLFASWPCDQHGNKVRRGPVQS